MQINTYGGPTSINLFFDAVLEGAAHLSAVRVSSQEHRQLLRWALLQTGEGFAWLPATPLIPAFHTQLLSSSAALVGLEELLEQLISRTESAHHAYREMESVAKTLFDLQLVVSSGHVSLLEVAHPAGDTSQGTDSALSALSGLLSLALNAADYAPVVSEVLGASMIYEQHLGFSAEQMAHFEHVLEPEPRISYSGRFDGSYAEMLDHFSVVADHGDIAVTRMVDQDQEFYAVHLAGLDFDLENRDQGRGERSLIDAVTNDSEQLEQVVQQALEAAGAPPGAEVALSGYSMGGLHAVNLAAGSGTLGDYRIRGVTTIGAPGANRRIHHEIPVVHFQDLRDPVPNLLTQRHQESTNRLTVSYEHSTPHIPTTTITGSAHTYQHNAEAVRHMENEHPEALGQAERELMDKVRGLYHGDAETLVFSTHWQRRDEPQTSMEDVSEMFTELSDHFRHRAPLPGRRRFTAPSGAMD